MLPVSLPKAWDFFSHPKNLAVITPAALNLRLTHELYGNEAYAGQVITYTVKPLLGIPFFWMTEITHLVHRNYFVDEQRRGPYALWHHQHHFREIDGSVEMTDMVHYQLPLYPFGEMALPLVKKKLKGIFDFRYQKIEAVLGGGQRPNNAVLQVKRPRFLTTPGGKAGETKSPQHGACCGLLARAMGRPYRRRYFFCEAKSSIIRACGQCIFLFA